MRGDGDTLHFHASDDGLGGTGQWLVRRTPSCFAAWAGTVAVRPPGVAGHGHKLDRVLTAKATAVCVLAGCLFPDQGYDSILAKVFGLPGLPRKPGTTVPSGPALSRARALLGEHVMRKIFEPGAAHTDVAPSAGSTWFGMAVPVKQQSPC